MDPSWNDLTTQDKSAIIALNLTAIIMGIVIGLV